MSPISNASRLAEFGSGIGTDGAVIQVDNTNKRVGIGTTNPQAMLQVGTAISMFGSTGIVSATTFYGDGSNLTGVANTDYVVSVATTTGNLNVSAAATITGDLTVSDSIAVTKDINIGAAATITGALSGSTGTFSGAVNIDATTDSTSTTTGALIVDGGAAIVKNVYIGAGLSVAGTLTYEDVTNVDSVGLITAKSGVNITGGELTVGSGITMGIAGVATFSGTSDVHLLDNVKLLAGDGSDLQVYHDGSHTWLKNSTGYLRLATGGSGVTISNEDNSEAIAQFVKDGAVDLYYNGSKKFETTNDGTVVTGMSTATTGFALPDGAAATGYASIDIGSSKDFQIYHHSNNHSYMINNNGAGQLIIASNITKIMNEAVNETCAVFNENGNVEFYHDNSKKWETTNDGTVTTGICTATDFSGASGGAADFPNGLTGTTGAFTGNLDVNSDSSRLKLGAGDDFQLYHDGSNNFIETNNGDIRIKTSDGSGNLTFTAGGTTERLRLDSNGKAFLHGTSATGANDTSTRISNGNTLNIHGTSSVDGVSVIRYSATYGCYGLNIAKSNSDTFGTNTLVTDGEELGHVSFYGADGTDFNMAAQITAKVDGTPSGGTDMPGALSFRTSAEASDAPTERLRITSTGDLNLGATGTYNDITGTGGGLLIGPGTGKNAGLMLRSDSDGFGRIYFGDNSGSAAQRHDGYIVYSQTDRNFVVGTATTTRITVGSAGQIGIAGANYGSSGQVLTSSGSGSAPSWADAGGGAWEVVSTTVLSGSTSDLQLYGWSNSYAQYKVVFNDCYHSSSTVMRIRWYLDDTSGQNGTLNTSNQYKSTNIRNEFASNGSSSFGGGGQFGAGDVYMLPAHVNGAATAQTMWSGELIFPMKTTSYSMANKCYGSILGTSYLYAPIGCKLDDDESKFLTGIHIYWVDNSGSPGARSPSTGRVTLLRMKYS